MLKRILFLLIVTLLVSCKPNIAEPYHWYSDDNRIHIIVEASQETWADPWQPVISIYLDNELQSTQLGLPVFVSEPGPENIKIQWIKEEIGKIIFTQSDDTEITLVLPKVYY